MKVRTENPIRDPFGLDGGSKESGKDYHEGSGANLDLNSAAADARACA